MKTKIVILLLLTAALAGANQCVWAYNQWLGLVYAAGVYSGDMSEYQAFRALGAQWYVCIDITAGGPSTGCTTPPPPDPVVDPVH